MKIEVGDRVTYKRKDNGITKICCVKTEDDGLILSNTCDYEILKIERPNWEVVEEKKELLTEEEREFLKFFVKHYDVSGFSFFNFDISVYDLEDNTVSYINYPENMEFEGVKRCTRYNPKELRIGGINK